MENKNLKDETLVQNNFNQNDLNKTNLNNQDNLPLPSYMQQDFSNYNTQVPFENLKEQNKKANTLCICSVLSFFCPYILAGIMFGIMLMLSRITGISIDNFQNSFIPGTDKNIGILETIWGIGYLFTLILCHIGPIVSFILMIVVRVKYPKNVFGKVLMWVYIIGFACFIIFVFTVIAACVSVIQSCPG